MTRLGSTILSEQTDVDATIADNVQAIAILEAEEARLNPDTLASVIADAALKDGDVLHLKDRNAGMGGGGIVDVVLLSTVTLSPGQPAFGRVVAWSLNTGDSTDLAIVVRLGIILDVDRLGAIANAGNGNTPNLQAIQEACDIGGFLVFGNNGGNGNGLYSSSFVNVTKSCYIDLKENGIVRTSGTGGFFEATGAATDLLIKNGLLDVQNLSNNFGHTVIFNSTGGKFELYKVKFQNNIVGFPTPTVAQDTDLVDVVTASEVYVDRCTFFRASRQGISITAAVPKVTIRDSHFEDCYLFGVDIEPNSPTAFMYDEINMYGNTFKNCGPKSDTNFVWNSGGPFAVASAAATDVVIVRNLNVYDNIIISEDFLNVSATRIEPFAKLDSYQTLNFENNEFDNLDRIIIATIDAAADILSTTIINNRILSTFGGNMQGNIFCFNSKSLIVSGANELRGLGYSAKGIVIIDGNTFKDTSAAVKANDALPTRVIVTDNGFTDCTTCIDITNLSERYVIIGNNSTGDTTFCLAVTNSTMALNHADGVNANGQFKASSNTVGFDFELGSPNGVQVKYMREDLSVLLDDEYFVLEAHTDHTSSPGLAGRMACLKDVANVDSYAGWEWFSGLSGATVSHLYSSFAGHLLPSRAVSQDNLQDLGSPTIRWQTVYAGTGAINTSDENLKQQIEMLTVKEKAVAARLKGLIRTFKFNDAVVKKGSGARIHVGVIAQDVLAAFTSEGLDGHDYAMFCSDEILTKDGKVYNHTGTDEVPAGVEKGTRLGIRYDELFAFIISVI